MPFEPGLLCYVHLMRSLRRERRGYSAKAETLLLYESTLSTNVGTMLKQAKSRLGTSVGLVGLPNVGKSTLFNALVGESKSFIANYPFATIEPCQAIISVPDPVLERHANIGKSLKVIPDYIEVFDIAGLVQGASEGKGLGNAFLGHIRAVDAIVHVVRCFQDANVIHVNSETGPRDPLKDIEVIELELVLADLDTVDKRMKQKKLEPVEKTSLEEAKALLFKGLPIKSSSLQANLRHLNLLTSKPVLYALISDTVGGDDVTRQVAQKLKSPSLAITARLESEVASETDPELREELKREFGLENASKSSISKLSIELSKLLGRRVFYTVGEQEARSWPLALGDTAVDAAGRIHTDIAKHFVNVEIRREVGDKPRVEGKDYKMQHGDIAYFRHRG